MKPASLQEAVDLLATYGAQAKLLAGGQSLIPLMKLRLLKPQFLIDISALRELSYIEDRGSHLAIGAMTTHSAIERSPLVQTMFPALHDAAAQVADRLIRNKGTIGGAIAHADPAGDYAPAVVALEGEMTIQGQSQQRSVKADEFFKEAFATDVTPSEVLTEIRLPKRSGYSSAYLKFEKTPGGFAIVSTACALKWEGLRITDARIVLAAVDVTPVRARNAERAVVRSGIGPDSERALSLVSEEIHPPSDIMGSAGYKKELASVLSKRAFRLAVARGQAASGNGTA